jgi:hypothetical protein
MFFPWYPPEFVQRIAPRNLEWPVSLPAEKAEKKLLQQRTRLVLVGPGVLPFDSIRPFHISLTLIFVKGIPSMAVGKKIACGFLRRPFRSRGLFPLTLDDYFFSAGAAGAAGAAAGAAGAASGALAEDIGFCSGAGAAAGAGAGAGASSFFLQPAVKARARTRHSAKEISFFIDVITSFLF